jgi:dGTPase
MTTLYTEPSQLAPYACHPDKSRGRLHSETESNTRSPFQRDRDRIIHSTAFRRLEYKTQVFVNHEGDHYRTRLTHSLEVSQMARSICRCLGLNEDLAEALALAHDLGHTPFGHSGEDALSEVMEPFGGFDHNAHTLRIVTSLEQRYADFDGLNLTWETLEGVAKHNGPVVKPGPRSIFNFFKAFTPGKIIAKPGSKEEMYGGPPSLGQADVTVRVARKQREENPQPVPQAGQKIPRALAEYNEKHNLELESYASGEAQVAALADDIAYNNHDIDDGLRAGLFTVEELDAVEPVARIFHEVERQYPDIDEPRLIHEAIRRLINRMVTDLINQTRQNIASEHIEEVGDIRSLGKPLVAFSPEMQETNQQLKAFLMERMYRHYKVNRMASKARRVIKDLFEFFLAEPECLPTAWRGLAGAPKTAKTAMVVADFIAGMTDRFALDEYRRVFDVQARSWLGK